MKSLRIFLLVLIIIGLVALATQKIWVPKLVSKIIVSEGAPDSVASVVGCYVAGNSNDVYTLDITAQQGENVQGNLALKNFEKDSSTGALSATYKNGILFGDYTFQSEGTTSVMQVIFKKVGNDFVRGYGDVDASGTKFTDVAKVTYDATSPLSVFVPSECASVTITSKKITEENFTGTMPIFSGSGAVVTQASAYVDKTISDFRKQANTDVPALKLQFGNDAPPASYEIDIDAKYITSAKTQSIEISVYTFTGGAHGSSIYKVFTAYRATGKIITLSDVIKQSEQSAFTTFVKKAILAWNPSGIYNPDNSGSSLFADDVNALTFADFGNFSLDDKNLNIYFDQYAIGPGSLGETVFPLELSKISVFMNTSF